VTIIMDQTTETRKVVLSFSPTFNTHQSTILLTFVVVTEVNRAEGGWTAIPESLTPRAKRVSIHNGMWVDPATELIVTPPQDGGGVIDSTGLIGAYDFIMSRSGDDIGMSSTADIVFGFVSAKLESCVVSNNLHIN